MTDAIGVYSSWEQEVAWLEGIRGKPALLGLPLSALSHLEAEIGTPIRVECSLTTYGDRDDEAVSIDVRGPGMFRMVGEHVPLGRFRLWLASAAVNGGQMVSPGIFINREALEFSADDAALFRRELATDGEAALPGIYQRPAANFYDVGPFTSGPWTEDLDEKSMAMERVGALVESHRSGSGKYTSRSPRLRPADPSRGDQLVIRIDRGYLSGTDRGVLLVSGDARFRDFVEVVKGRMLLEEDGRWQSSFAIAADRRPFRLLGRCPSGLPEFDDDDPDACRFISGGHHCTTNWAYFGGPVFVGCCTPSMDEHRRVSEVLGDGNFARMIYYPWSEDSPHQFSVRVLAAGQFVDDLDTPVQWLASPPAVPREDSIRYGKFVERLGDVTAGGQLASMDWLQGTVAIRPLGITRDRDPANMIRSNYCTEIRIDPPSDALDPSATLTLDDVRVQVSFDALCAHLSREPRSVWVFKNDSTARYGCRTIGKVRVEADVWEAVTKLRAGSPAILSSAA